MSDELKTLARAYADGEITETQVKRLEFILQRDAQARQSYLQELNLINALEDLALAHTQLPERIRETNHIWIIYKIAAVMWLVVVAVFVYAATTTERFNPGVLIGMATAAAIHFSVIWFLGRITVEVNHDRIKVGMGPFKSKTSMDDIESIRCCTIRPIRDFKGWGWRPKWGGIRGFIGDGHEGIEFTRKNGRRIVATVRDPQRFVDFVDKVKADKASSSQ